MKEIVGDYWKEAPDYKALVCTTNCVVKNYNQLVMGAGIAKDFKERFGYLPELWGYYQKDHNARMKSKYAAHVFATKHIHKETSREPIVEFIYNGWLIAFPTKLDWKNPSIYKLIECSAQQLLTVSNALNIDSVLMTRPGCGNGGLQWPKVKEILDEILDDRFVVINKE